MNKLEQFGATGDGTTDDYQSIQDALDFAQVSLRGGLDTESKRMQKFYYTFDADGLRERIFKHMELTLMNKLDKSCYVYAAAATCTLITGAAWLVWLLWGAC